MPIIDLKDEIYSEDMGKVISEEPDGNPGYVSDKLAEFWPFDISFSDDKITISFNITTDSPILTINNGKLSLVNDREDIDKSQYAYVYGDSGLGWYKLGEVGLDRGVFGGGYYQNVIDYVTISSPGNAQDFGDLTVARRYLSATSNGINNRGVFGGGYNDDGSNFLNTVDYITISSPGNAQDFGDLTVARRGLAATSNGTNNRGVFGGGYLNVIDYIIISSPGNASDFGDLTVKRYFLAATSNSTNNRGVFGGGYNSNDLNVIDYVTISSPGNATDFGDLTVARRYLSATSNGTNNRGVFSGGWDGSNYLNVIDYITISSLGNAQDFGDLTVSRRYPAATSNGTNNRGVFGGGSDGSKYLNTIDYITISSPGNAQDFGDLTVSRGYLAATSNA